MDLNKLTIKEAKKGLAEKSFSAAELTESCLKQIEKNDGEINAFVSVMRENAMHQAEEADAKIRRGGEIGEMEGIPLAIKDNILISGERATAGSKILENYVASYDAAVIARLKKAGAIFLGKTNMDEFAMGSSTESSYFGPTKNPCDLERVPGGSSGGSAAAVAGDMCLAALGSDTGGSVRQPASFCGVVGLKPTYGRVSRHGLMSMASSLDQIGPLAKTVGDARILLNAIAGNDPMDSTTAPKDYFPLTGDKVPAGLKDVRIGVPREFFSLAELGKSEKGTVNSVFSKNIARLEDLGAKVEEISLPRIDAALAVYYMLMPAEVSSNLARYDGIRFGFSAADSSESLAEVYLQSREKGFGKEAKRRIMLGTYVLSAGYYDAYYLKARKVQNLLKKDFEKIFDKVDLIITPTSPCPAFRLGEKSSKDPLDMYLSDIYTVPANIIGVPAISVPGGFVREDGNDLPVGLQLMGKWFEENALLGVAEAFEKNQAN